MHRLLEEQISKAKGSDGQLHLDALISAIADTYERMDVERRGMVRSMQLMSSEAKALTRDIEQSTVNRLQTILDNIKDAILTIDDRGCITAMNATAIRVFGGVEREMLSKPLSVLLPDLPHAAMVEELERLAARMDDTQRDLAPHETAGLRQSGERFNAEMAVSKFVAQHRASYVVCLRDTTERKLAEAALRDSEARYRRLFDNVIEGVYSSTPEGRILSANPALVEMAGCRTSEELLAVPAERLYVDPAMRARIITAVERDGVVRNAEFELRRVDGGVVTVVENGRAVRNERGEVIGYEGTITDITERKRAEQAALQEKDKAQITLRSIGDAVITTDSDQRVEYLNPVAEELTGWPMSEALGAPLSSILCLVHEVTRQPAQDPVSLCLREQRVVAVGDQAVLLNRRGQEIAIKHSAAPIRGRANEVIGAVLVFHDVSKERRLRHALVYQATHDALTGLMNRREFENRLTDLLKYAHASDAKHALLYLDLDQFKLVNDTCGHQAGDLLLKQVTSLLQTRIRSGDVIARLGGDEFGVLLQDCEMERAETIADNLRQAIRDFRFAWQDVVMQVGVSIGIVNISRASDSIGEVLSAADVACYSAKEAGRNRIHTYQQGKAPERHREMQWASRLTRAVEENRFELFYQPIVAIGSNVDRRRHYELLLRMRGEKGELILPGAFIPAAERYSLMPAIDRWVVQHALGSLAHYRNDGPARDAYTIAINLSGTSLSDDRFLEFLIGELMSHDVTPGSVCFEITETAAIANLANALYFMKELKARGCLFSLDDFGSGLSSFTYLKNMPVDYLKIDGQFVQHITTDRVDRSMVEAIRQVGRAMGIKTVAERVESAEVLLCLATLGIDYAQGNYVAQPESAEVLSRVTNSSPQLLAGRRA